MDIGNLGIEQQIDLDIQHEHEHHHPPLSRYGYGYGYHSFTVFMKRAPIHDDDDDDAVARKGKVVTTTGGCRCTTTKAPPILVDELIREILLRIPFQFAKDHFRHLMALDVDRALTHTRVAYYDLALSYPTIGVFCLRSVFGNPPHHEPTKVVTYQGRRYRLIIGSCNGLLCLHDRESDRHGVLHRAMLWNPCTGLTSPPLEIGGAFTVCGFGYDNVNDKYKLFGIVENKQSESVTRIFTFGPNSTWRTMQDFPCRLRDINNRVFLTYTQFSVPSRDSNDDPRVYPTLGTLRGCLDVCYETKKTHWTIWLMKDYGVPHYWTKLAIIPHHPSLVRRPTNIALRLIHMLKNNVLLAIAPNRKFVLFNLNDGSIDFPNIDSSGDGACPHIVLCLSIVRQGSFTSIMKP
ncbi:hypothetical protein PIB30_021668 [Stylosanthes scabra]|uniref:F-box associated beta-propeller type 3 domain-containing protein n=1 Tax=Stylosanthes scabra TaxID=79078 RepID=A0ABU6Z7Y6_9FABA|nr:hypothetical protein [Stylosanthes scabra]